MVENFRDLLWHLAIVSGWLGIIALAGAWHARKKFRTLLKDPLTDEVERQTHVWERRIRRWTALGLLLPGLSILYFIGWWIIGMAVQP